MTGPSRTGAVAERLARGVPVLRRGFGIGLVVWFLGLVLTFLATPMVGTPLPVATAPVGGTVLTYLGFHLWFVLSTGDLVLGYGPGPVLVAIPFAVTLAGGTAAAVDRRGSGALAGASIAVGYAFATLVAYAGAVVLVETGLSPLTLTLGSGVETLGVLAVNGVVQPAVAGAVGGALGGNDRPR